MYQDFREYLSTLDARSLLSTISRPVDKDWEIAAVCRVAFQDIPSRERPALKFTNIQGHSVPLVAGVLGGSDQIYATALSTTVDKVLDVWSGGARNPIPPVLVDDGPVHENVHLAGDVDVRRLPHPIWTVGQDPGPYITSACVISKDPETGVRNVGTYRFQIKGRDRLGMMASPRQGVGGNPPSSNPSALLTYAAGLPVINTGITNETTATPNAAKAKFVQASLGDRLAWVRA